MSGHSKWATTKRQKAVVDAKRGAIFTKLGNVISIAARRGGDPEMNAALRAAIDKARESNMPKDNIERAVKKGTGELGGNAVEELYYEGMGPAGTQFIVKCITDSKNRSASEVRHVFSEHNSSLGSVMWNFEQKGVVMVSGESLKEKKINPDELELELIDAGIDDLEKSEDGLIAYTHLENLQKVKSVLESKNLKIESAEIEYTAKEKLALNEEDKEKVENFIEELEDLEDVNDYYTNAIL